MRRVCLSRWRPPYRDDLHEIWLEVMRLPPKGDLRAKELYLKARALALVTKENLSELVWALATFQPDKDQEHSTQRDEPRIYHRVSRFSMQEPQARRR
jgi:hypothetical protein